MHSKIQSNKEYDSEKFISIEAERANVSSSEFVSCKFEACDFSYSIWDSCRFESCSFENVNLGLSKFLSTKLINCKFSHCRLMGIDWSLLSREFGLELNCRKCDLSYSQIVDVEIPNSKFVDCKMNELFIREANLSNCDFGQSDLLRTVFDRVNLKGANFIKSKNYIIDPSKNNLNEAKFNYPEVMSLLDVFGLEVVD